MGEKTDANLKVAFRGEAEAHLRNLAYSKKEGWEQIARMFRAIADAEKVHCLNALNLMKVVKDTESNLKAAFESEMKAKNEYYPPMIKDAEEEGASAALTIFSHARDVENYHAAIYKKALDRMMHDQTVVYHVCQVCGYIAETDAPDN
ncbi:MAG: ferritin family protein, partial [Myxococcota bacterium]